MLKSIIFIITIAVFLSIVIISIRLNKGNAAIGQKGERKVRKILKSLPRNTYSVFNNIMLKTAYGTTQIDHIIVSIYGIFVIETKNYKGIITGNSSDKYWKQNINHTGETEFYSPAKQNAGHVKALESALHIEDKCYIIPIITFAPTANVTVWLDTPIVYFNELKNTILKYNAKKINEDDVVFYRERIKELNISSKQEAAKHVDYINNQSNK